MATNVIMEKFRKVIHNAQNTAITVSGVSNQLGAMSNIINHNPASAGEMPASPEELSAQAEGLKNMILQFDK